MVDEVLYQSEIHPEELLQDLPDDKVSLLSFSLLSFSFLAISKNILHNVRALRSPCSMKRLSTSFNTPSQFNLTRPNIPRIGSFTIGKQNQNNCPKLSKMMLIVISLFSYLFLYVTVGLERRLWPFPTARKFIF